jgi:hypothetical protein
MAVVTSHVVSLIAANFKPYTFPVSAFALSCAAEMFIA